MTGREAVDYIESQGWSDTRLGLSRTKELLSKLGNPEKKLKFIHVAGTNGKGSTCAMLASVLQNASYRTGLYTSPYICRFNERMQVNGTEITDYHLAEICSYVIPIAENMDDHPSQFELVTAIAMKYFLDEKCDIVVLEVGLGGALDSTNVIEKPECSVICNIGLEHTEYLGNTLPEIAEAKSGIIKRGCPTVCYRGSAEVEKIISCVCREKQSALYKADFDAIHPVHEELKEQVFDYGEYKSIHLPLLGEHQQKNAAVVLKTIEVLQRRGWNVSKQSIYTGLAQTKWPARFEVLQENPPIIIDGAHNPQCASALSDALDKYLPGKDNILLIGVLADKDYKSIIDFLKPHAKEFVCVSPPSVRALSSDKLAEYLRSIGERAESFYSLLEGINAAVKKNSPVVVCGSLYMVGHVRKTLLSMLEDNS